MFASKFSKIRSLVVESKHSSSSQFVPDKAADFAVVEQLAKWLDAKFVVPGLGIRFGLDAIIGLLPGVGDAVTSLFSLYILSIANRHNVSRVTQTRMAANIALDWLVGSIPLVGDLFDVAWKANTRNVNLLKRHLSSPPMELRKHRTQDWLFLGLLVIALLSVLGLAMFAAFWMVKGIWNSIV